MAETEIQKARRLMNEFTQDPKQAHLISEFQQTIEQMNPKMYDTFKKLMPDDKNKQFVTDTADLIRQNHEQNQLIQDKAQHKTLEFNLVFRTSSKLEEALDALRENPDSKETQQLIKELPEELQQNPDLREEFDQFAEHLQNKDMKPEMDMLNHMKNGNADAAMKMQMESQNNLQQSNASESAKIINESRKNLNATQDHIASTKYLYNTRAELTVDIGKIAGEQGLTLSEGKDTTGQTIADKLIDTKNDMNELKYDQRQDQQVDAFELDAEHEQAAVQQDLANLEAANKQDLEQDYQPMTPKPPTPGDVPK